jgi:hypothetical protein
MNGDQIRDFVFAGNATFTIVSKTTGKHFTYKLRRPSAEKPTFISVMTGGSDEYNYLGIATPDRGAVLTAKSKFQKSSPAYLAVDYFLRWAASPAADLPAKLEFYHAGRCGRCGRELTDPVSIERGLGPECAEKL